MTVRVPRESPGINLGEVAVSVPIRVPVIKSGIKGMITYRGVGKIVAEGVSGPASGGIDMTNPAGVEHSSGSAIRTVKRSQVAGRRIYGPGASHNRDHQKNINNRGHTE